MGDHQMAAELYSEAYAIYLQSNGDDSWYTQVALKHLNEEKEKAAEGDAPNTNEIRIDLYVKALEARESGNLESATSLYTQTHDFRCEVLGNEHPLTLSALADLASIHTETGDFKKACELYEQLYTAACNVFGAEHQRSLSSLKLLEEAKKKAENPN